MAAVFALSLVPAGAFAEGDPDPDPQYTDGTDYYTDSKITIANPRAGETYSVYKLFDLDSFLDYDYRTGQHAADSEAYSYVIDQYVRDENGAIVMEGEVPNQTQKVNPWWTFLTGYDTDANTGGVQPYAVVTSNDAQIDGGQGADGQLFWIQNDPVSIPGVSDTCHVIYPTAAFKNFSNRILDDTGDTTLRTGDGTTDPVGDADGTAVGINYATAGNSVVQSFAQEALKYAKANSITPDYVLPAEESYVLEDVDFGYYLVGSTMGTLASLDTTNSEVTIYEKNDEPSIEKKVLKKGATVANENGERLETVDYLVGGTAEYAEAHDAAVIAAREALEDAEQALEAKLDAGGDSTSEQAAVAQAREALELARAAATDWVFDTDADAGDFVQFRTVVTAQQGAKGYVIHDVMEPGLVYHNSSTRDSKGNGIYDGDVLSETEGKYDYTTKVYLVRSNDVYSVAPSVTLAAGDVDGLEAGTYKNYRLNLSGAEDNYNLDRQRADGCDFEVALYDATNTTGTDDSKLGTDPVRLLGKDANGGYELLDIEDGDKIVVTYWAVVKPEAVCYGSDVDEADPSKNSSVKYNDGEGENGGALGQQANTISNADQRNTNSTVLTYGAHSSTTWSTANVTTYQFDIAKTALNEGDSKRHLLAGAQFELYKAVDETEAFENGELKDGCRAYTYTPSGGTETTVYYKEYTPTPTGGKLQHRMNFVHPYADDANTKTNIYSYAGDNNIFNNAGIEWDVTSTGTDGEGYPEGHKISVRAVDSGTYVLVETVAPSGYNRLAHPVVVTISGDDDFDGDDGDPDGVLAITYQSNNGVVDASGAATDWEATLTGDGGDIYEDTVGTGQDAVSNGGVHVVNQTGTELPSTGGIGTTIFYVAGTVLVVGAAVMLVAKRRMGAEA